MPRLLRRNSAIGSGWVEKSGRRHQRICSFFLHFNTEKERGPRRAAEVLSLEGATKRFGRIALILSAANGAAAGLRLRVVRGELRDDGSAASVMAQVQQHLIVR